VLEDGRIVESGAHAQLITQNGLYARLYATQFGYAPDGGATTAPVRQEVTRAVGI
jgi:hypothetical protein